MKSTITKIPATELLTLEKKLIQLNLAIAVVNSKRPKTYAEYKALKDQYDDNFNEISKKVPLAISRNISGFKMTASNNLLDPNKDYRNLSEFTDDVIKHNVDYSFSVDPSLITIDKNSKYYLEAKKNACEYLMNIRDLCQKGDIEMFCLANTLPYEKNDSDITDEFNGMVFAIKNKMYDLQQAMLNRATPKNLYIDKGSISFASRSIKGSYTHTQELAIASAVASKHPNLIFYVTLDRLNY